MELNESVPIAHLPHLISEQIKRKRELERDLAEIKENMDKLRIEELELFDQLSTTRYDLEEYQQTVQKFQSYGLLLHEDTQRISNFLENLDRFGGDVNEVFRVLGDIRNCKTFHRNLQLKVSALRLSLKREGDELQLFDQKLASGKQLLSQYKELEKLGIGLSDLKRIHDIVIDIASSNFLNPEGAFRNFTNDILKNYDTMVGIEARTLEIKKILSASQQKYLSLEAEYSKKLDVYNKTADLIDHGIQPFEILQMYEIIRVCGIKFSRINQDLDRYANLTNAADQIESRVEKLRDESHDLFLRVASLKAEEVQISQGLKALHEKHDATERGFVKRLRERKSELRNKMHKLRLTIICEKGQALEELRILKEEEKKEMSLLLKMRVPQEFCPIIEAARGNMVDGEGLRKAVVRSMELLIQRLDEDYNGHAKSDMRHALESLKSEFMVF